MKRILCLLCAIVLIFAFTACESPKESNSNQSNDIDSTTESVLTNAEQFTIHVEHGTYIFELESGHGYSLQPGKNDPAITSIFVGDKRFCATSIFDQSQAYLKEALLSSSKIEDVRKDDEATYTLYKYNDGDDVGRLIIVEFAKSDAWIYFEVNNNHYHINEPEVFTQFFNTVKVIESAK